MLDRKVGALIRDTINELLDDALARATEYEYDLPSAKTVEIARSLLEGIGREFPNAPDPQVEASVDGSIEMYLEREPLLFLIEISPTGRSIHAMATNVATGEVVLPSQTITLETAISVMSKAA